MRLRRVGLLVLSAVMVSGAIAPLSAASPSRASTNSLAQLEKRMRQPAFWSEFQKLALERAGLLRGSRRAPAEDESPLDEQYSWAFSSRDLNGDRAREVMVGHDIRTTMGREDRIVFTVLNGPNGRPLWRRSKSVPGGDAWPIDARVGPKGRNGFIVAAIWHTPNGRSLDITNEFYAYDAKGKKLWSRKFQSRLTFLPGVVVWDDQPVLIDLFDAFPGRADDLLVAEFDVIQTEAGLFTADVGAGTIDGRNGAWHFHGRNGIQAQQFPVPGVIGDVNRDGLEDYAMVDRTLGLGQGEEGPVVLERQAVVEARKGSDGSDLWTLRGPPVGPMTWPTEVGHVTGDKRADFTLETYFPPGNPVTGPLPILDPPAADRESDYRTYVIDGAGRLAWKVNGAGQVESPGDIDRDGRRDIVVETVLWDDTLDIIRSAYSLKTRKRIYRRTFHYDLPDDGLAWFFMQSHPIGDLQPDRTPDNFLQVDLQRVPGLSVVESRLLSGRNGLTLRKEDERLMPLSAAVDRRGNDVALIDWAGPTGLDVTAQTGTKVRTLWKTRAEFNAVFLPKDRSALAGGARHTRDRCADVLLQFSNGSGGYVAMLNGANGKGAWVHRVFGKLPNGFKITPGADHNKAC